MSTATSDNADRTVFQMNPDADPVADPDVYVTETFTNEYGDDRAYLDGDTYNAKEVIKFDWETTHHDFNDRRKEWVVDADALDILGVKLEQAGFTFEQRPPEERRDGPLFECHDEAEEGDDIVVEYHQKNGNGTNTKAGSIVDVGFNSGYEDKPMVAFRRDSDDHYMYVQYDKTDDVVLYTGRSHSPFVGEVETITLEAQR